MASSVPELLVRDIKKNYDVVGDIYPVMGKDLFNVADSDGAYELVQSYVGYGMPQPRGPGGPITESSLMADFGMVFLHSNYAMKDVIPNEFIRDDPFGMLTRWASGKASSMAESYMTNDETLAANFLTNSGFATSLPPAGTADGQAIFSLTHPISRVQPAVSAANMPSVAVNLSMAALQAGRANLEQQRKANNETIIKNRPRRLVFNPNYEEIALQCLRSNWVPGTADRDMNTLQMRNIEPFSWPYWQASGATSATAYNGWFMQGETHFLTWFVREAVNFDQQQILGINSIMFASFQRQSLGAPNWRGLYGSLGS